MKNNQHFTATAGAIGSFMPFVARRPVSTPAVALSFWGFE